MQKLLLRLLSLILILSLAWLWVMLSATPALAKANKINYTGPVAKAEERI